MQSFCRARQFVCNMHSPRGSPTVKREVHDLFTPPLRPRRKGTFKVFHNLERERARLFYTSPPRQTLQISEAQTHRDIGHLRKFIHDWRRSFLQRGTFLAPCACVRQKSELSLNGALVSSSFQLPFSAFRPFPPPSPRHLTLRDYSAVPPGQIE